MTLQVGDNNPQNNTMPPAPSSDMPPAPSGDIQLSETEMVTLRRGLLCMGPLLTRNVKRLVNMHRLAKAILHSSLTLPEDEKDLVVWVLLAWRCPLQLNWWLQARTQSCKPLWMVGPSSWCPQHEKEAPGRWHAMWVIGSDVARCTSGRAIMMKGNCT